MADQLIKIKNTDSALLSKEQKKFNAQIKKIRKLRQDIVDIEALKVYVTNKVLAELQPLEEKLIENECIFVLEMDKQLDKYPKLHHKQRTKAGQIILEMVYQLVERCEEDGLKRLVEKYAKVDSFDDMKANEDKETAKLLKKTLAEMGIELDIDFDNIHSQDELKQKTMEAMARKKAELEEEASNKPKSEKQQTKADKAKLKEREISASTKEIYKNLVKNFHPDKEQDAEKRLEKTEIMQQITQAYQTDDLLKLLELQHRLAHENTAVVFDEKALKNMNILLKRQAEELETERSMGLYDPRYPYRSFLGFGETVLADMFIKQEINDVKSRIKSVKYTIEDIRTEKGLKGFISGYDLDDGDDDMGFGDMIRFV